MKLLIHITCFLMCIFTPNTHTLTLNHNPKGVSALLFLMNFLCHLLTQVSFAYTTLVDSTNTHNTHLTINSLLAIDKIKKKSCTMQNIITNRPDRDSHNYLWSSFVVFFLPRFLSFFLFLFYGKIYK